MDYKVFRTRFQASDSTAYIIKAINDIKMISKSAKIISHSIEYRNINEPTSPAFKELTIIYTE